MGAIPIIQHWEGVGAFIDAGIDVLSVKDPSEINLANLTDWMARFKHGNDLRKLTREYWNELAFNGSTVYLENRHYNDEYPPKIMPSMV